MRAPQRPSAFISDAARDRYYAVYDAVLDRLWPVPVEPRDVETRAGIVRVYSAGPAGNDPLVLSGAGGNALAWYGYVRPLAQHHRVLAVDPLGEAGRSVQTQPISTGEEAGVWLADVLDALGVQSAHLVGSSFGAWTALEHQLCGGDRVGKLTLVDPAGFAPVSARFYKWLILGGLAAMFLPRGLRHRAAHRLVNGTLREDELMTLVRAGRGFRRRLPSPPDYTDEQLRGLQIPVQVLLGEQSTLHDAAQVAARLAAVVPTWRVEIVPGTGHALPVEAPELVIDRLLAFDSPHGPGGPEKLLPSQP